MRLTRLKPGRLRGCRPLTQLGVDTMSSRALRKLQREQELQKQLAAAQGAEEDVEESEEEGPDPPAISSTPRNAFDMLEELEEGESDGDDAGSSPLTSRPPQPPAQTPSMSKPSKPKKKKKKAKKKPKDSTGQSTPAKEESEDEVDRALKELQAKTPTGDGIQDQHDATSNWEAVATRELAIDTKSLNPVNEMRSLFGNVALEGESRPTARTQQQQRRRGQHQREGVDLATALTGSHSQASRGKELGTLAGRRNVFMQGKEEWPLASSGGLSMEHTPDPSSFEKLYNVMHSSAYQETQRRFRMVVESYDPQQMITLLVLCPYHIATLLQVSEIAKHQGDHSVSGDLLERALFSFGRSVHSSFPMALREGTARIPFDKSANRELYLTIWRYIRNLEMRGTWKTAFEWAKLLLQLNTLSDPYGVTLMIDQLALRGRSHDQLLKLASDVAYGNAWRHLPNIQISLVLAYLRSKQPREARKQLALCIHHYPYIISALASALDISPLPKSLWAKLPSTDAEKLYTELYVSRAKDLWNTPETSALIVEVADTLQYYASTIDTAPPAPKPEISLEEARHIMLLETPQLIALLPRRFTTMPTSSFDVLAPPYSASDSDFVVRAPTDGSGISIMQNIMNAGAATAGATGNTIFQSLLNFRNWFNAPVESATQTEDGQAALRDLQRDLGREGMSPEMIEQFLQMQLTDEGPGEQDGERITLDGLGMPNGMAGNWDYYADAADNNSEEDSDTNDSMPALEDIPTQETRPAAALTPPPQQSRNPRAAMVEEDDDDDDVEHVDSDREMRMHGHVTRNNLGGAILRRVDSDGEDDPGVDSDGVAARPEDPVDNLLSTIFGRNVQRVRTQEAQDTAHPTRGPQRSFSPTTPSARASAAAGAASEAQPDVEADPQRLQRWLLTTGLNELQADRSHSKVGLYVRRMKMLRKQQQDWILNMVAQRGWENDAEKQRLKELVERVRQELGS